MEQGIRIKRITKYIDDKFSTSDDHIIVEEPLEIRLSYGPIADRKTAQVAITMRTPGQDDLLALGFLYNEGIVDSIDDVMYIKKSNYNKGELNDNIITVYLNPDASFDTILLNRNFYTTSSCGICGKASIDAVSNMNRVKKTQFTVEYRSVLNAQTVFEQYSLLFNLSGGNHAVAYYADTLAPVVYEDVGRHNALDKLSGHILQSNINIYDKGKYLVLSGRASFELIQKAAAIGFNVVCAFGAPSSLAIATAEKYGITLIGFLKKYSFNVYSGSVC